MPYLTGGCMFVQQSSWIASLRCRSQARKTPDLSVDANRKYRRANVAFEPAFRAGLLNSEFLRHLFPHGYILLA
jgi:hypothetical protein